MRRLTLFMLLSLLGAGPLSAAPSCRITNFGILAPAKAKSIQPAPGTASGAHRLFDKIEIQQKTDKIPARLGTRFGVMHRFRDIPKDGKLEVLIRHPEITNLSGTKATASLNRKSPSSNGTSWGFYELWELRPGKWVFEFYLDEKLLCKKEFTVVKQ